MRRLPFFFLFLFFLFRFSLNVGDGGEGSSWDTCRRRAGDGGKGGGGSAEKEQEADEKLETDGTGVEEKARKHPGYITYFSVQFLYYMQLAWSSVAFCTLGY